MIDFTPQGPDFDINKFLGDTERPNLKKFYCPTCGEKVHFSTIDKFEDDNYECPMCQNIMLLEE